MQIIMWDIRKGRSGVHQLGAYGPAKQPVLAVISIRKALAAIPGLSLETHIPDCTLHQLLLDPLNDTRAGYTLGCGWQGRPSFGLHLQRCMHYAIRLHACGMQSPVWDRHRLTQKGVIADAAALVREGWLQA